MNLGRLLSHHWRLFSRCVLAANLIFTAIEVSWFFTKIRGLLCPWQQCWVSMFHVWIRTIISPDIMFINGWNPSPSHFNRDYRLFCFMAVPDEVLYRKRLDQFIVNGCSHDLYKISQRVHARKSLKTRCWQLFVFYCSSNPSIENFTKSEIYGFHDHSSARRQC